MLFLLLVFSLLRYSNSAAVPSGVVPGGDGAPLLQQEIVDNCTDINHCRTLFSIVWSCLTTIFACTWTAVHPNLPAPNIGIVANFWRKFKMMLVAMIAPELMVAFALRQCMAASYLAKIVEQSSKSLAHTDSFFKWVAL
ncbi:hypothetical protein HMN09_00724700 [Mycena chlorophos]|uniref:Uncharacterized protein n=1 Tax=Mycena chlorophos TaxID=658473 RepID=A0A8H6W4S2_MYCCL|nr:hypothetical protein HMN09_00724700 [Mycena chlorophos]